MCAHILLLIRSVSYPFPIAIYRFFAAIQGIVHLLGSQYLQCIWDLLCFNYWYITRAIAITTTLLIPLMVNNWIIMNQIYQLINTLKLHRLTISFNVFGNVASLLIHTECMLSFVHKKKKKQMNKTTFDYLGNQQTVAVAVSTPTSVEILWQTHRNQKLQIINTC